MIAARLVKLKSFRLLQFCGASSLLPMESLFNINALDNLALLPHLPLTHYLTVPCSSAELPFQIGEQHLTHQELLPTQKPPHTPVQKPIKRFHNVLLLILTHNSDDDDFSMFLSPQDEKRLVSSYWTIQTLHYRVRYKRVKVSWWQYTALLTLRLKLLNLHPCQHQLHYTYPNSKKGNMI